MTASHSLIAPTANPLLERAIRDKLQRRNADAGSLGALEPLALRLGLMQNTLKPRLHDPQLVIVASDHGLAVDGNVIAPGHSTADEVHKILTGRMPVSVLASTQGLDLTVIDAGMADRIIPHDRLLTRKIAHGTRNTRLTQAMTVEQAHAAIRAGMEIGDALAGNAVACAGLGIGGDVSAALVLSRLSGMPVRDLLQAATNAETSGPAKLAVLTQTALTRHREVTDPIEVLAAMGGFEVAMLAGVMLVAAQRRHLIMVDGLPACTALLVASKIASAVTDYCVFCRSQQHDGLNAAMRLFQTDALLELNLDSTDGSGAVLSWPLVRSAAALLTEVAEGEDAGPTLPGTGFVALSIGETNRTTDQALLAALGQAPRTAPVNTHAGDTQRAPLDTLPVLGSEVSEAGAKNWHSPFNQQGSEDESLVASADVDTQRDAALQSR